MTRDDLLAEITSLRRQRTQKSTEILNIDGAIQAFEYVIAHLDDIPPPSLDAPPSDEVPS